MVMTVPKRRTFDDADGVLRVFTEAADVVAQVLSATSDWGFSVSVRVNMRSTYRR